MYTIAYKIKSSNDVTDAEYKKMWTLKISAKYVKVSTINIHFGYILLNQFGNAGKSTQFRTILRIGQRFTILAELNLLN